MAITSHLGSHPTSPTNFGGVDGLTGAARGRFGRGGLGAVFAGFTRVWRFEARTGIFAEITRRHAEADSHRPKCSLVAFLGRERQRAVNRWRAAVNRFRKGLRDHLGDRQLPTYNVGPTGPSHPYLVQGARGRPIAMTARPRGGRRGNRPTPPNGPASALAYSALAGVRTRRRCALATLWQVAFARGPEGGE